MNIQSLSIVVPTKKCVNNCAFCVSKTHDNDYKDESKCDNFEENYIERLEFAKDNGTNTIILTGTGEALQNKPFLKKFAEWNKKLHKPFYIIELQTTGVFLDDETLKFLRDEVRVKTISLSVSDLFDNENNLNTIGVSEKLRFNLDDLVKKIKDYGFNLRISLNVLKSAEDLLVNKYWVELEKLAKLQNFDKAIEYRDTYKNELSKGSSYFYKLFDRLKELSADQITFRKMWKSNNNNEIDKWIENNTASDEFFNLLNSYIKNNGKVIGKLTFGALQYEVGGENGISTVIDGDCMSDEVKDSVKYLILRENGKLYFKWNSKSSLVF